LFAIVIIALNSVVLVRGSHVVMQVIECPQIHSVNNWLWLGVRGFKSFAGCCSRCRFGLFVGEPRVTMGNRLWVRRTLVKLVISGLIEDPLAQLDVLVVALRAV
jgi:hypothetical protein